METFSKADSNMGFSYRAFYKEWIMRDEKLHKVLDKIFVVEVYCLIILIPLTIIIYIIKWWFVK